MEDGRGKDGVGKSSPLHPLAASHLLVPPPGLLACTASGSGKGVPFLAPGFCAEMGFN